MDIAVSIVVLDVHLVAMDAKTPACTLALENVMMLALGTVQITAIVHAVAVAKDMCDKYG